MRINNPKMEHVQFKNIGKYITLENSSISYKIIDISFNNNYIIEVPCDKGVRKRELPIQVYDYVTISDNK